MFPAVNFSYFTLAGYLIFLGMIADVLDGHIARISKSTSSFGAQLDSLCDVITFGVAPAFLMSKMIEAYSQYAQFARNNFVLIPERIVLLIAIVYVMCAIIRLARFNVENKNDDTHLGFVGLPSPSAAGMLVSIIVFQQDFLPRISRWHSGSVADGFTMVTFWVLPCVALLVGILMVSRIPFPHALNSILRGKKRFSTFLLILFVLPLMIWNIQLTMVLGFSGFALFGVIRWLFAKTFFRKKKAAETEQQNEDNLGSDI